MKKVLRMDDGVNLKIKERLMKGMSKKVKDWKHIPILNINWYVDTKFIYDLSNFTNKELEIKNPLDIINLERAFNKYGPPSQWFILERGWGKGASTYIVNTEGYDYCRYIAKLGILKYKIGTTLTNCVRMFG